MIKNAVNDFFNRSQRVISWLRGPDLNQRPPGYEPDELPTALPRDIYPMQFLASLCRELQVNKNIGAGDRGRTGTIGKDRRILSPVRLPIPPLRHKHRYLNVSARHPYHIRHYCF